MSFFNNLQQYVTSSVANLGLGSRRFSLSRQDSGENPNDYIPKTPNTTLTVGAANNSSGTTPAAVVHHAGFPKVVPTPCISTIAPPLAGGTIRRQSSRGLECMIPPRQNSFRQRHSPVQTAQERSPLAFCKRRMSWPEMNVTSTSGVQESDGSFFESFTALSWKRENRRMSAVRAAEARAEAMPIEEKDTIKEEEMESDNEKEQLYMDVLYTIANTVGCQVPGGQFAHYKDEMYLEAQKAFGVSPDRHYRLLHVAVDEKPKVVVLSVVVLEADGLEAKDANGFSDPYCMLGITPMGGGQPPLSPQPPLTPRTLPDTGMDSLDSPDNNKLRKHSSFRLSFKRKDGSRHRDSMGPIAARLIKATSVKPHTLCPKWNEKFKFDIDEMHNDQLHLDIWDHDDESCVFDAVSRLNEVRGVRGLGRFFKQVCQSARQGSQDDFLGSITIPISDIPSTGLEGWFKLEGRSQRSSVQGRIRLKLWLSTRDDHGQSEDDVLIEIRKYESLNVVFMTHELLSQETSWTWNGEIQGSALTILHQIAVQGDLSELQCAMARFVAATTLNNRIPLDPRFIHKLLIEMDRFWVQVAIEPLGHEQEQWLAQAMSRFVEQSLNQMRRHREMFPALHPPSLVRLEFLLRCLGLLGSMRAFRQVCPFSKGVRGEIVNYLRKGSVLWAQHQLRDCQRHDNPLVIYSSTLLADLQTGLTYYHPVFDNTNGVQYFSIVYKQFDTMLADEVTVRIETGQIPGTPLNQFAVLEGREPVDTRPFELYFALQEFAALKQHLSVTPQPPEKPLGIQCYHLWFEPIVQLWIAVSKTKALQRVRTAVSMDEICEGEKIVRHSTSAVDTASCVYQLKEFWRLLLWPDPNSSSHYEGQLLDAACSTALHYSDLIHQGLVDAGYYEHHGPFRISDELCVSVNNLEYVRRALSEFRGGNGNCNGLEHQQQQHQQQQQQQHHQQQQQQQQQNHLDLNNTENVLENTLMQLERTTERIMSRINVLMQAPLQKSVFHLAWSPDSLPANQAIIPLLEYLDQHLSALNSALLTKNFHRALTIIWLLVLNELSAQMDSGGEKPTNFHDRLYEALQMLVDFIHAEGLGLIHEIIKNEDYWRVEQRLQYHKTDTDRLMDMFYIQRLQEQMMLQSNNAPPNYGVLAVRAYFNHDSLCVEVLHAKDVIPLDPNGFSDPFVIVELLPRRVFSHCNEQQTHVHKKTLNPVFDECFEFSVTLEQCLQESAMVGFTVMDHDVLTANDFAGECFLSLNNIPGVAECNLGIENFHGLKQIDLVLMQQKDKHHPIFQILECRTFDKVAIDFVRKQKARVTG